MAKQTSKKPAPAGPRGGYSDIVVGAPARGDIEFVIQRRVEPDSPFSLELPGEVFHVGGQAALAGIIPAARVVLAGRVKGAPPSAFLQFAERDQDETEKALAELDRAARGRALRGFGIRVEAEGRSFGDVVAGAAKGKIGRSSPAKVTLYVVATFQGRRTPLLSPPFNGLLAARAPIDAISEEALEAGDIFGTFFDCHSHWFRQTKEPRRRFTVCHGPCAMGRCGCGTPPAGVCIGWRFCFC